MPKLVYDLTGQTFGILVALHHVDSGNWLVRCECGTEKVVMGQNLRTGRQKSCGCQARGRAGSGASHPRWKANGDVTYSVAHKRVRRARGPAREHPCSTCGGEAHSWAYQGGSDQELLDVIGEGHPFKRPGSTRPYSPDPADYDPMCWGCHARKDVAEAQARAVE